MAKYTVELGKLLESNFDIGLKTYPIFDENYRKELNDKIIEHYYFREIGAETAELFKRYLNRTMCEIMPYYNKLYESELIKFNPLHNFDRYETHSQETTSNTKFDGWTDNQTDTTAAGNTNSQTGNTDSNTTQTTGDITTKSDTLDVNSDTPQGMLSIGDIKSNTYASNASMNNGVQRVTYDETRPYTVQSDGSANSNSDTNTTETANTTATGKTGTNTDLNTTESFTLHSAGKSEGESYSKYLQEYRETFLNIDMMIIHDLEILFMQIY